MRDAIDLNLEAIRSIRTEVDSRPFGKKNGKKKGYIYTILRIFHSFCDKPVLAGKSVRCSQRIRPVAIKEIEE